MTPAFALEFFLIGLLSLFSAPTPFGVPPMPEDPRIAQAAPAETVLFVQWFGEASPMPGFPNDAAKFGSQPEVRAMADAIIAATAKVAKDNAEGADPDKLQALTAWGLGLARRPGCAFATRLTAQELKRGPRAGSLGLVINVKDDVATAQKQMEFLEEWFSNVVMRFDRNRDDHVDPIRTADDVEFRPFRTGKRGPLLSWAIVDGYLAIGFGDNFGQEVTDGLRKGPGLPSHPGYQRASGSAKVATPCWRAFADLEYLFGEFGKQSTEVAAVLKSTGLSDAKVLMSESGIESKHYITRMSLPVEKRRGVLALFDGGDPATEDLGVDGLRVLPGDSEIAAAIRIKPELVFARVLEAMGDPELAKDVKQKAKGAVQAFLGFDLEEDILMALGDRIAIHSRPVAAEGAPPLAGLTITWSLRDAAKIAKVHDRLIDTLYRLLDAQRDPAGAGPELEEQQIDGVTVYSLKAPMPVRPHWCIKDGHLVISLFEHGVKDVIQNGVVRQSHLGETRLNDGAATASAVGWIDWPELLPQVYPLAQAGLPSMLRELEREGFVLDPKFLPSLEVMQKHLQEDAMTFATTPSGITFTRTGSLPHFDLGVLAVIGCAAASVAVSDM